MSSEEGRRAVPGRVELRQTLSDRDRSKQIKADRDMMFGTVAVLGATGAVGRIMLELLQERQFAAQRFLSLIHI